MNQSIPLQPHGLSIPRLKDSAQAENPTIFWRRHAWWPLLAFAVVFGVLEVFSLDRVIAREWYFNVHTAQWLGAGSGEWWARGLLHTGGRWVVRGIAAAALVLWALSFAVGPPARMAEIRRLRVAGDAARHADRRRPESRHQRGLPVGPCRLRRPQPLRRAVRRPARRTAARAVFSGRPCVVRLRALLFLFRIPRSLAPRWRAGCWRRRSPSASRSRSARKHAARISSRTISRVPRSSGSCSSGCTRVFAGASDSGSRNRKQLADLGQLEFPAQAAALAFGGGR